MKGIIILRGEWCFISEEYLIHWILTKECVFLGKKCILPNKNAKYMSLSFLDYIITMVMQSPPEMLTLQNTFLSLSVHSCHSFCSS